LSLEASRTPASGRAIIPHYWGGPWESGHPFSQVGMEKEARGVINQSRDKNTQESRITRCSAGGGGKGEGKRRRGDKCKECHWGSKTLQSGEGVQRGTNTPARRGWDGEPESHAAFFAALCWRGGDKESRTRSMYATAWFLRKNRVGREWQQNNDGKGESGERT